MLTTRNSTSLSVAVVIIFVVGVIGVLTVFVVVMFMNSSGIVSDWNGWHRFMVCCCRRFGYNFGC